MSELQLLLFPSKLPHKRNSFFSTKLRKPHFSLLLGYCGFALVFTSPSYGLLVNVIINVPISLSILLFIKHDRVTGYIFLFQGNREQKSRSAQSYPDKMDLTRKSRLVAGPLLLGILLGYGREMR
jgi:hypothetical protein